MIVVCPNCQARYRFDESKLGDRPKVKTRCAKCSGTIEIVNPASSATMPPDEVSLPPTPAPVATPAPAPAPTPAPGPAPAPAATPAPVPTPPAAPARVPPVAPGAPEEPFDEEVTQTRKTPVQHSTPAPPVPGEATVAGGDAQRMGLLRLPPDKRFSLAVIQGSGTGTIFQITSTRTVIGRSGTDINIEDPEASRQHAALEIVGDVAVLRDLGSTNGTWIELERVEQQQLSNQQEFRIGSHVLMFIVTDVE